jgi:hypothetical protein
MLPLIAVGCFPTSLFVLIVAAAVTGVLSLASGVELVRRIRGATSYAFLVRAVWLIIAVVGLVALIDDVRAVSVLVD